MNDRTFASSRGKIIRLLRRAAQTVNDLARALGLTDNAVRASLARLERDGWVQQAGSRPSFRKPESVYDITPQAEQLFSRAYMPVLLALLGEMQSRLPENELDAVLRDVGRRMAATHLPSLVRLSPDRRTVKAMQIMEELGGFAELEEVDGRTYVRGFGCPFAQAVADHPKLCVVAEALLGALLGRPVEEQCARGERPRCRFRLH
jgi:predicted ArsR family transcriptional regulator